MRPREGVGGVEVLLRQVEDRGRRLVGDGQGVAARAGEALEEVQLVPQRRLGLGMANDADRRHDDTSTISAGTGSPS
jgi:hypothetical protein